MGWSYDLQRCKLGAGKMRNRARHPGSPFSTQKTPFPRMLSKFHQLLQSWDSFFLFPTINFLWGLQFGVLREYSHHICKLRRHGREGKLELKTQVWTGEGGKGAAAQEGNRRAEAAASWLVCRGSERPAAPPSPQPRVSLPPITPKRVRRPHEGAFPFLPLLTHQHCFSVNL